MITGRGMSGSAWKSVVLCLACLIVGPPDAVGHPDVNLLFEYHGRRYDIAEDLSVLRVVYGTDFDKSLPYRVRQQLDANGPVFERVRQLSQAAGKKASVIIRYTEAPSRRPHSPEQQELHLPHELPEELRHLDDDRNLSAHLVGQVARTLDETLPVTAKSAAFRDGWARYNERLIAADMARREASPPVAPTLEKEPTLQTRLEDANTVCQMLEALDGQGRHRAALDASFGATNLPSRTFDTFLMRYSLDNPEDVPRVAKIFDHATSFSATPKEIVFRLGPSTIEYAFDERNRLQRQRRNALEHELSRARTIAATKTEERQEQLVPTVLLGIDSN